VVALSVACSSDDGTAAPPPAPTGADTAASTPSATGPVPSAGCEAGEAPAPGATDRTMTSGGQERYFRLVIPDLAGDTSPRPLVLGLHALTVDNAVVPTLWGLDAMGQTYGAIVAAPSGLLDGTVPYWQAAPVPDNPDIAFIADLLDVLEDELCIDTAKVFATGMSNGGQLSSLLACQLPERITAVVPVAGVEFSPACGGSPVPVMAFHGAADPIVGYGGGGLDAVAIADQQLWKGDRPANLPEHRGVDDSMARWADNNGCDSEFEEAEVAPSVRMRTWSGCEAATSLYIVDGGGHQWPGRPVAAFDEMFGPGTSAIDATSLAFELFLGPPPG
jgi:polyhydroxybutyrate depolymerase